MVIAFSYCLAKAAKLPLPPAGVEEHKWSFQLKAGMHTQTKRSLTAPLKSQDMCSVPS